MERRPGLGEWALVASLILHGALVALVLTQRGERRAPALAAPATVEIEFVEVSPPPRSGDTIRNPRPTLDPGTGGGPAAPAPATRDHGVTGVGTELRRVSPDLPDLPAVPPELPALVGGGPEGAGDSVANPRVGAPLDLFAPGAIGPVAGKGLVASGDADGGGDGKGRGAGGRFGDGFGDGQSGEVARVASRIGGWIGDAKASDRVASGIIDPYFSRARLGIARTWNPTWEQIGQGGESKLEALRDSFATYFALAERYGKTGNMYAEETLPSDPFGLLGRGPLEPDRTPPIQLFGLSITGAGRTALLDLVTGRAGGTEALCLVLLHHGAPGEPLRAELVMPSGFPDFDRGAIEEVKAAVAAMGPRPAQGFGLEGQDVETLWAMKADYIVLPPVPMVAGTFDEVSGEFHIYKPLDRIIHKQVVLLAVYAQ